MRGIAALRDLEQINFQKFLRRNFVEPLVIGSKLVIIAVTVLLLYLSADAIYGASQNAKKKITQFEERVDSETKIAAQGSTLSDKKPDFSTIAQKSIFGPIGQPTAAPNAQGAQKPATNLPMTLIGTFITKGQDPYAIIEEQKKKAQDVFVINDMVFGDAKLVAIHADHVEIERNGKIEILSLDTTPDRTEEMKGGVASLGNDEFVVDGAELDKALENLPLLLTQARAVPFFKEGRAVGLRLFAIKSGSLFEKIGLQNGDVLKAVNGSSLADLSQAMQLFQKLKEERSLSLTMERNMVEKEMKYQIR